MNTPIATPSSGRRTPSALIGHSVASTLTAFGLPDHDESIVRPIFEAVKQVEKQGTDSSELPVCEPASPKPEFIRAFAAIGVRRLERQNDMAYHLAACLQNANRRGNHV